MACPSRICRSNKGRVLSPTVLPITKKVAGTFLALRTSKILGVTSKLTPSSKVKNTIFLSEALGS